MDQAWEIVGIIVAVLMVVLGLLLLLRKPKPSAPMDQSELAVEAQSLQPIVPRHLRQIAANPEAKPEHETQTAAPSGHCATESVGAEASEQIDQVLEQLEQQSHVSVADTENSPAETCVASLELTAVAPAEENSFHGQQRHVDSQEERVDLSLQPTAEISEWQGESDILDAHINAQNRQDEESALATAQQFVALYLYPSPTRALSGERALRLLLKYGLRFGEMSCFHRYQDPEQASPLMFSVLRINDDGAPTGFDLEILPSEEVKGLAFFLALPNQHAVEGFDMMVSLSGLLAREIEGSIFDEQSLELSPQLRDHWRHFVIEYKAP
jgi:cell division protein ZipA